MKLVNRTAELEKEVRMANQQLSITKEVSTKMTVCEHMMCTSHTECQL